MTVTQNKDFVYIITVILKKDQRLYKVIRTNDRIIISLYIRTILAI